MNKVKTQLHNDLDQKLMEYAGEMEESLLEEFLRFKNPKMNFMCYPEKVQDKKPKLIKQKFKQKLAFCMVIIIIVICFLQIPTVKAAFSKIEKSIEEFFHLEDNSLEENITNAGMTLTKDNITITLQSVLVEGKEVIVNYTVVKSAELEMMDVHAIADIYYQGESVRNGNKSANGLGDKNKNFTNKIPITKVFAPGEIMTVHFDCFYIPNGVNKATKCSLDFDVAVETVTSYREAEINKTYELTNGLKLEILNVEVTAVETVVNYCITADGNIGEGYGLRVEIKDEQGDINRGLVEQLAGRDQIGIALGSSQTTEWEKDEETDEILKTIISGECYAYKLEEESSELSITPILTQNSNDIESLEEIKVQIN